MSNQQKPFFAEDFHLSQGKTSSDQNTRKLRPTHATPVDSAPAQPVVVDVHWDEVIPTLNATLARVDEIAHGYGAQAQATQSTLIQQNDLLQQVIALQQQVTEMMQQHVNTPSSPANSSIPQGELEKNAEWILNALYALHQAATEQVTLSQQQLSKLEELQNQRGPTSLTPASRGATFEEMTPLLEEIRERLERLTDAATGLTPSQGEYIDRQREQLVDSLYARTGEASTQEVPPLGKNPSSTLEQAQMGHPRPVFEPFSANYIGTPTPQNGAKTAYTPEKSPGDTLFVEEETYLAEKKEYLDERRDYLTRKRAWTFG